MDLPQFAPRRKFDHYLHHTGDIKPILNKIENLPKNVPQNLSPDKNRPKNGKDDDILAVLHGIGPEGCSAVASLLARLKQSDNNGKYFSISEPLIELWEGIPTFHAYILSKRNKGAK